MAIVRETDARARARQSVRIILSPSSARISPYGSGTVTVTYAKAEFGQRDSLDSDADRNREKGWTTRRDARGMGNINVLISRASYSWHENSSLIM